MPPARAVAVFTLFLLLAAAFVALWLEQPTTESRERCVGLLLRCEQYGEPPITIALSLSHVSLRTMRAAALAHSAAGSASHRVSFTVLGITDDLNGLFLEDEEQRTALAGMRLQRDDDLQQLVYELRYQCHVHVVVRAQIDAKLAPARNATTAARRPSSTTTLVTTTTSIRIVTSSSSSTTAPKKHISGIGMLLESVLQRRRKQANSPTARPPSAHELAVAKFGRCALPSRNASCYEYWRRRQAASPSVAATTDAPVLRAGRPVGKSFHFCEFPSLHPKCYTNATFRREHGA